MRYIRGGFSLRLESSRCNGCGRCVQVCPHAVFLLADRKAAIADRSACMECGACQRNCASQAIRVSAGVGCAYAVLNARAGQAACGSDACSCQ